MTVAVGGKTAGPWQAWPVYLPLVGLLGMGIGLAG